MMKKLYIVIFLYGMICTDHVYAMEIARYSHTHHRPPVKEMINNVSGFACFNKDIQGNIIRKMFDIPDKIDITITLKNAIKYYLNIKQYCPLKVGNKTYSIEDILFLDYQRRQQLIFIAHPSYVQKKLGYSHDLVSLSNAQALEKMPDHIRKGLKFIFFEPNLKTMFSCDEEDAGMCFTSSFFFCLGAGIICCDDRLDCFLRILGICPICGAIALCACYIGMKNNCSYRECFDKNYKEKQY